MLSHDELKAAIGRTGSEGRCVITDADIHELLSDGTLQILPDITSKTIQPASIDVRIGRVEIGDDIIEDALDTPFVIQPREQAKVYLHEALMFDHSNFTLDISLRSSRNRLGLRLLPHEVQHDGLGFFVMITNQNPNPVKLYGRSRFAQIFLHPKEGDHGRIVGDAALAQSLARSCTHNPHVLQHFMVFTVADTLHRFKKNVGIIDTNQSYSDEELYETLDTNEGILIQPEDTINCLVDPPLALPKDVGVMVIPEFPLLNVQNTAHELTSTSGWVDPNFHGTLTLHAKACTKPTVIRKGMPFALGLFYKYSKEVEREYGHKELESNYQHSEGEGFRD